VDNSYTINVVIQFSGTT